MKSLISLISTALVLLVLAALCHRREVDVPKEIVAPHVTSYNSMVENNRRLATGFHLKFYGKVYIVTNRHVCDHHKKTYGHDNIQFNDYVGKIIKIDDVHDLCLVTSNRTEGLVLAEQPALPQDKIYLVGHPRGIGLTIREGRIISEIKQITPWIDLAYLPWTQISTPAYPGNSGSPITNERGEVVGVLFAGSLAFPLEPFAVPYRYLVAFLYSAVFKLKVPDFARR
jgi:S1-C subfamily serine protease